MSGGLGEALNLALALGFFGWFCWAVFRRKRVKIARDGPPDEKYRVYSRQHDLTVPAADVPEKLAADGFLQAKGWISRDPELRRDNIDAARALITGIGVGEADPIRVAFDRAIPGEWAICLLIDHSGSMRGEPIQHAAATAYWASKTLAEIGVSTALLGFSTVGWQGGRPRQDWLDGGRPKRPGRLCALLHIVYQQFGDTLAERAWETMLHPDILCENIDGEAIEWASAMLGERPEPHKLLIVLSDGASVDDSTLTYNGAHYLERHLLSVIGEIENGADLMLGAVGINHRVDRYYSRSRSTEDPADLPAALASLIAEAVNEVTESI